MESVLFSKLSNDEKQTALDILRECNFTVLFMDEDQHPLVFDASGLLRFEEDQEICRQFQSGELDLNRLAIDVQRGIVLAERQRKIAKSLGYSVWGYFDLDYVQKWAKHVSGLCSSCDEGEEDDDE